MVADTNVIEMTLIGAFGSSGVQLRNVFQYAVSVTGTFSLLDYGQSLIDAWSDSARPFFDPIQNIAVAYSGMQVKNLMNPLEIFDSTFLNPLDGDEGGECLPPFTTWGFLLKRSTAATRNGYKRFSGVPEVQQVNGQPTAAAALLLQDMAEFLGTPFPLTLEGTPDVSVILTPTIVRKSSSGAIIASQPVVSAQFRSIGTQNTRKFGRGA